MMESFVREYLVGGLVLAGVMFKLLSVMARLSAAEARMRRVRIALASMPVR
jgi:hypothetical protein